LLKNGLRLIFKLKEYIVVGAMKEKNILVYVLISLIIGGFFGFGLSYLIYKPQIDFLNSEVTEINRRLDSRLSLLGSDLSDLKSRTSALEIETGTMDTLEEKIRSIESENQATINSIESSLSTIDESIDEVNTKLGNFEVQIQNEGTIIDAYNNVSPSVVFITSTVLTFDFLLQQEVPTGGVGSGVVVSPEGYIITNNHVVEGAEIVTVSFKPGEEIEAEVVGTDPPTDLAVLKIDPFDGLPVATLGDSDAVRIGMTAIAIGNPFSLDRTVTTGVVSSVNRTLDAETGDIIFGIIQTDASINPGNSGGPLINSKGEVIGVNSAIISPVRGSVGIGFSIPVNTAKKIMVQLIEHGRVSRPYVGVTLAQVSDFPSELNLPEEGVLIIDVVPDSPAEKAGIIGSESEITIGMVAYPVGGDVIIKIDDNDVSSVEDLLEYLSNKEVGETIKLGIIRNNIEISVKVLLGERPE
jgi:putative serine protease PepD